MADNFELLQQAIDRNTPITFTLPSAGMQRAHRSRLLSVSDEGILFESIAGEADAIDVLIKTEQPVTISFRSDTQKVEFTSRVLKRLRGHRLNASTLVEAVLIDKPTSIKAVQRRNDYRVSVPSDSGISFRFWRITEQADLAEPPMSTALMVIDIRDFSVGGCGGTWKRRKEDPPIIVADQRLRVELDGPTGKAILDARLRFLEKINEPDFRRVGVQFVINATSIQDRQKTIILNKLLSELQRQELRRKKFAR